MQKLRTIFLGTSDYCLPVLASLSKWSDLALVITRPDKPEGRKAVLTASATKKWADEHKVPTFTPQSLRKDTQEREELITLLTSLHCDLAVVSDFGLIIPESIFSLLRLGTVNIHFSRLPKLRGPSPVQFKLLQGKEEAWVTLFKLDNGATIPLKMDSGPILYQQKYSILASDTTNTLYSHLFSEIAMTLPDILGNYTQNPQLLTPQNHNEATFCRFLTKDDGFIRWEVLEKGLNGETIQFSELPSIMKEALNLKPSGDTSSPAFADDSKMGAEHLYNFYRGITPWPGMWTMREEKRMKILKCHLDNTDLVLDEIQYEGKRPQTFAS